MVENDVDVCNMGLGKLGISDLLESLEGDGRLNTSLLAAQTYYKPTRNRILQQFNWGFARTRRDLQLVDKTIPGYAYVYRYPADCFQFRRIVNQSVSGPERADDRIPYKIFEDIDNNSKLIACDEENAIGEYTIDGVTPPMYSPLFVACVMYGFADEAAPMLKADAKLAQLASQKAQYYLNEAGLLDLEENQEAPKPVSEFEEARR